MLRFWGFGIVNKVGEPWWEEGCVCEDRAPLEDHLQSLNDPDYTDAAAPYRIVRLYFIGKPKRKLSDMKTPRQL